jgi:hypothetical protein
MRTVAVSVLLLSAVAPAARAQSGAQLLNQGIEAFRALEMGAASRMLRLSLDASDLADPDRPNALAYLGAAEFYRGRRDSAFAAFERLILLDPRYRLDPMAFAPEVAAAFDDARRATPVVSIEPQRRVSFEPGRGGLATRIYASTPHTVRVRIEGTNGEAVRTVFEDRIIDSGRVVWDGNGRRGARLASGLYTLSIASVADGRAARTIDVPVRLARGRRDSLLHPPPPAMLPERASWGPGLLRLGLGIGAAGAALVVIRAFTDDGGPRYATAVVLTAAGVIGFFEKRPGRPYPDNVVANEVARSAWEAQVQDVIARNRRRRPGERIVLETGRPATRPSRR